MPSSWQALNPKPPTQQPNQRQIPICHSGRSRFPGFAKFLASFVLKSIDIHPGRVENLGVHGVGWREAAAAVSSNPLKSSLGNWGKNPSFPKCLLSPEPLCHGDGRTRRKLPKLGLCCSLHKGFRGKSNMKDLVGKVGKVSNVLIPHLKKTWKI